MFEDTRIPQRIWAKVYPSYDTGCWLWCGASTSVGYGHTYLDGKHVYVHRYLYETLVDDVEPGLELDHLCCEPSCCNPKHLEPVTNEENVARRDRVRGTGGWDWTKGQ